MRELNDSDEVQLSFNPPPLDSNTLLREARDAITDYLAEAASPKQTAQRLSTVILELDVALTAGKCDIPKEWQRGLEKRVAHSG